MPTRTPTPGPAAEDGPSLAPSLPEPLAGLLGAGRFGEAIASAQRRLPFMFGLDAGHNSVVVHPPRQPAGELEVRQDTCLSDPIAVAPLPARPGRHDLCLTFTALTFDPLLAVDWAGLAPPAAARP